MNNRTKALTLMGILVVIAGVAFLALDLTNLKYMQVNPELTPVNSTAKTFIFEWDGNNSTITIVNEGKNVTIPVTFGQQFVCDRPSNIYQDNKILLHVP